MTFRKIAIPLISVAALSLGFEEAISVCDGLNTGETFLDNTFAGGPMIAMEYVASDDLTVSGLEVFTGEAANINYLGLWSDNGGAPGQALGWTDGFQVSPQKNWQGAELVAPVNVVAGQTYWVVWDPQGGEQTPFDESGEEATYYGSGAGTVQGDASWDGPYSNYLKYRVLCGDDEGGCS